MHTLKILGANVQNLVTTVRWCPWFVYPRFSSCHCWFSS